MNDNCTPQGGGEAGRQPSEVVQSTAMAARLMMSGGVESIDSNEGRVVARPCGGITQEYYPGYTLLTPEDQFAKAMKVLDADTRDEAMPTYSAMKKRARLKRALSRFFKGRKMWYEYKLVTLTTPPDFDGDIHRAWRKLVMRLRRRGLMREYYAVKEWNKKHTCTHLHVVFRADWIAIERVRREWTQVVNTQSRVQRKTVWVNVEHVRSQNDMAFYLAKYLQKQNSSRKRGYWYAYEWILRGWHKFTRTMWKWGRPVLDIELETLHRLMQPERSKMMFSWLMTAQIDWFERYYARG